MDNSALTNTRRELLAKEVGERGLSVIAKLVGKPDSQIKDMIAGRKSFGDKVAREIGPIIRPDLRPDWLLSPSSSAPQPAQVKEESTEYTQPTSRAAAIANAISQLADDHPALDAIEMILAGAGIKALAPQQADPELAGKIKPRRFDLQQRKTSARTDKSA